MYYLFYLLFFVGKNVEDSLIKSLSLVSAIGVDLEEELYAVTIQVVNPAAAQKGDGGQLGFVTYQETGRTITEALNKIAATISRKVFLDDTEIIIVSEELAKTKGIHDVVDFFILEPNISSNIIFFVSKDYSANTILNLFTPVQPISAQRIMELMDNIEDEAGFATKIHPNRVKNYLLNFPIVNNIIPYITIEGDVEKGLTKENIETYSPIAKLKIQGMAFFKEDKLQEYLPTPQSTTLLLLTNHLRSSFMEAACPDKEEGHLSLKVNNSKTKIKPVQDTITPTYTLHIKLKGKVEESTCKFNFEHPNLLHVEKQYEEKVKKEVEELIATSFSFKTDFIGFGKELYLSNPKKWEKETEKWSEIFPSIQISEISVTVDIDESGDAIKLE